jgi:tRNA (guanine37-N1)-methyltransferase
MLIKQKSKLPLIGMQTFSMQYGVITLFPEIMQSLQYGVVGRALNKNLISVQCWNPRDFANDNYQTVDDVPYGGGPGMVLKYQPVADATKTAKQSLGTQSKVIYLSPQGRKLDHQGVKQLAAESPLIFLAGRYEGIDQRVIDNIVDEQWSLGDYVLSGGELAACVMIDCITRLLPGVLGDEQSAQQDSFVEGLLDHSHYTRPETIANMVVPNVLLSGDHQAIANWRLQQALGNTWRYRPDLLEKLALTDEQRLLLDAFIQGENHE